LVLLPAGPLSELRTDAADEKANDPPCLDGSGDEVMVEPLEALAHKALAIDARSFPSPFGSLVIVE